MSKSITVSAVFCRNNNLSKIDEEEESNTGLNFSTVVYFPVTSFLMEAPARRNIMIKCVGEMFEESCEACWRLKPRGHRLKVQTVPYFGKIRNTAC